MLPHGRSSFAVVASALVAAGCGAGGPDGVEATSPAAIAPQCSAAEGTPVAAMPCRSPDRRWSLTWRNHGSRCDLYASRRDTGRRVRIYHTTDAPCSYLTWVRPHLLVFDDDYRVLTLDPPSRKVTLIGGFSDFDVSPDERWIAGYAFGPPEDAETVDVLSVSGGMCLVVPHTARQTDEVAGFTRDSRNVIVLRRRFVPNNFPIGSARLVQYAISSLRPGSSETGC